MSIMSNNLFLEHYFAKKCVKKNYDVISGIEYHILIFRCSGEVFREIATVLNQIAVKYEKHERTKLICMIYFN